MDLKNLEFRYTELGDEIFLRKWMQSPGILKGFPLSTESESNEFIKNWIGFSKWHSSLTGVLENEPCALATLFLMPYRKVAHHCLFYIIVDPTKHRQGIGFSLLKNLKHLAKEYFCLEMMHCDVYGNDDPSYRLLLKSGFQTITRQKHFVKEENKYLERVLMNIFL